MTEETRIALKNYDWMIRNGGLDYAYFAWESNPLVYGEGGGEVNLLCEPGFTPATEPGDATV